MPSKKESKKVAVRLFIKTPLKEFYQLHQELENLNLVEYLNTETKLLSNV